MTGETNAPLLEARAIVKRFGALLANDDVTLALRRGEIHALLGENGAGKSTLVKVLYGALQPDGGEIYWKGERVGIASPAEARRLGIGMVFQHFSLFDALTVAENIAIALPKKSAKGLTSRITEVSRAYGLPLNPKAMVADLSVGERQRIEIVRCLLQEPDLIILDEPTSVLTPQEAEHLFCTLDRLAGEGKSVLYISHRLEEVRRLCHKATIMRRGKVVAEADPAVETAAGLARLMVGSEVKEIHKAPPVPGPVRLELIGLNVRSDDPFGVSLKEINLKVLGGEIVAIAGVAGNGQGEFFDALSGEKLAEAPDQVRLDGHAVGYEDIRKRRNLSAAFVPEERLGHGAVPGLKLSDNVVLTRHSTSEGFVSAGFVVSARARAMVSRLTERFDIRKGTPNPEARALSGGNLQKFVVGREVDRAPGIFIVSQPTWGVDAGAAAIIRQSLIDLARGGAAVLVISQDLDEIFEIADRIAVISRGELSPAEPVKEMSLEKIGLLMAGGAEKQTMTQAGTQAGTQTGAHTGGVAA